jgi:N-methylhydantoinase A
VRGPAVFEENESTFVVGPGSEVSILKDRTIFVKMTA